MNQHAWISAVLDDMVAYALRNDLAEVGSELDRAAAQISHLLDTLETTEPTEEACDVILMPARRA